MSKPCVLCGNAERRMMFPIINSGNIKTWLTRCQACGTCQPEPFPEPTGLHQAHDESSFGPYASKFRYSVAERYLDFFRQHKAVKLAKRLDPKSTVLDFGCGNGRFLYHLSKRGDFQLYGTELPGKQAERAAAASGAKILSADFEKEIGEHESLDAITMFHVLEHLTDPAGTMEKLSKMLRPGGYLIISMPNINSLQARLFGPNWLHLDPDRHVFFPPLEALSGFLESLGIQPYRYHTYSLEQNPFGMVQSLLNTVSKDKDSLFNHMKGVTNKHKPARMVLHWGLFILGFPLFALTDRMVGLVKQGATITLIARKNDQGAITK